LWIRDRSHVAIWPTPTTTPTRCTASRTMAFNSPRRTTGLAPHLLACVRVRVRVRACVRADQSLMMSFCVRMHNCTQTSVQRDDQLHQSVLDGQYSLRFDLRQGRSHQERLLLLALPESRSVPLLI
jgi:hypothetical protein